MKSRLPVVIFSLTVVACGSSKSDQFVAQTPVEEPIKSPPSSLFVESATKLPACTAEREGSLVYIKDAKQFQTCAAGAWSVVDIKGDKGDAGAAGAAGTAGAAGAAGAKGEQGTNASLPALVKKITTCQTDQAAPVWLTHEVTEFFDGSVMIKCANVKYADSFRVENVTIYKPNQNAAVNWGCFLTADEDTTATSGFWAFSKQPDGSSRAVLNDLGDPQNGSGLNLPCTSL